MKHVFTRHLHNFASSLVAMGFTGKDAFQMAIAIRYGKGATTFRPVLP